VAGALVALAERLQGICLGRGLTVALAESCTGGIVAAAITSVPGSSGYFLGGVVSYSDAAKTATVDVPATALAAHGAVSAQVAKAMATGARARFDASLAASITGVSGPDGGSAEKPVGLTYVGLASGGTVAVRRFAFAGDRGANREAAALAALEWLIERAEAEIAVKSEPGTQAQRA
jgi:PncC family amidohydrolase